MAVPSKVLPVKVRPSTSCPLAADIVFLIVEFWIVIPVASNVVVEPTATLLTNVVAALIVKAPVMLPLVNEELISLTATVLANLQLVKSTLLAAIVRPAVKFVKLPASSTSVQVTVRSSLTSLIEARAKSPPSRVAVA